MFVHPGAKQSRPLLNFSSNKHFSKGLEFQTAATTEVKHHSQVWIHCIQLLQVVGMVQSMTVYATVYLDTCLYETFFLKINTVKLWKHAFAPLGDNISYSSDTQKIFFTSKAKSFCVSQ